MHLVVCLKLVPDPLTVEASPFTGVIDPRRLLYRTNLADEGALELALSLAGPTGRVSALTVGPPAADEVARQALAVGASQAWRLWDASLPEPHPFATATLLAAAVRALPPANVILCGARSSDRGSGTVPALLAELLGLPVATDVTALNLTGPTVQMQRRLDRGAREELVLDLPAVVGLEPGPLRLRQPALPQLLAARRTQIELRTSADLGLRQLPAPASEQRGLQAPRPRPRPIFAPASNLPAHERISQLLAAGVASKSGSIQSGPPEQLAARLVAFLRERGFIP
ncbi:MAG: electron transfer flavoprotein subunit beta/FixA family protein [Oscillochloridaceae bacterium umkhey_bin13]